jgi:hypothetical protein
MKRILRPPLFFFLIPDSLRFNPSARCSDVEGEGKGRAVVLSQLIRHFLNAPDMLLALTILQLILGLLWWGWTEIPLFFREAIHKMLQRRRYDEKK